MRSATPVALRYRTTNPASSATTPHNKRARPYTKLRSHLHPRMSSYHSAWINRRHRLIYPVDPILPNRVILHQITLHSIGGNNIGVDARLGASEFFQATESS